MLITSPNHKLNNENYDVAIQLLNEEFLHRQFINNEIFKQINERTTAYDVYLVVSFKHYITRLT